MRVFPFSDFNPQSTIRNPQFRLFLVFLSLALSAAAELPSALGQPRLTLRLGGEMGRRVDAVIENWLLTAPAANPAMLEMFRMRDRQPPYENPVPWAGEFAGKYLTSAVLLRRMTDDPRLDALLQQFVPELIATQADDGYLGPFPQDQRLLGNWDLWGHYHVMLGLYLWYHDTRDRAALDAAVKAADLICNTYLDTDRRVYDAGSHEMNMAVIHILGMLHRETGNERYLRMMQEIMQDWERPPAGDYYRQGVAEVEFYQTPKPRWESLHPMQGLGEMYRITGYQSYRDALLHFWHSIRRTDIHNAGSFSTNEGAVGNPFAPGAIETCCTVAWLAYSTDALLLSADSTVADAIELATWSTVLGYEHPSGRWCTYNTPMDGKREASAHTIVFQCRPGTPELNCCSVNGPRGLGMIAEWAVFGDSEGLYLNYYGPGEISAALDDSSVWRFVQTTDYPVSGAVRIEVFPPEAPRVEEDHPQSLPAPAVPPVYLRIPEWSKATKVTVNGEAVEGVAAGSYLKLERAWRGGDTIELELDMSVRALRGDEHVNYNTSLYHGPLLLAYDQKFNTIEPQALPALDFARLTLARADTPAQFAPMVLLAANAVDGNTVVLCDYATAGAHGTFYRSWLPVENAPPVAFYLRRPANGAALAAGDVLLQWTEAGPDETYTVRVASDPAFNNVVREMKDIQSAHVILPGVPRQDAPLYWDVTVMSLATPVASENGPWSFAPSRIVSAAGKDILLKLSGGDLPNPGIGALEQATDVTVGAEGLVFNGGTSRAVYTVTEFPVLRYTAAARLRPEPFTEGDQKLHEVMSAWCRPSDDPLRLVVAAGQAYARIEQQGANYSTAGVAIPAQEWTHLAIVKDGPELRLYVNGLLAQTTRVPEILDTQSQAIGLGSNPKFTDPESFHGTIADVQFATRAYTDAEILALASKG